LDGDYLVPVRALSRLFRGHFLDLIRKQFEEIHLPESLWQKDWVVHCKSAVQGTRSVLNYHARYIHRVAITNSRIASADDGKVTFRYKGSGGALTKAMTVIGFASKWLGTCSHMIIVLSSFMPVRLGSVATM